jgi:hypothetical protein
VRIKEGGRLKKRDSIGNIHIYIKVINASSILEMVNIEQSMLVGSLRSSMAKFNPASQMTINIGFDYTDALTAAGRLL